ncbi:hypothetical protein MJN76_31785, partial [Salmonella enterica subsp. enterica serovar Anatum]|nr:hypothetical protein [Salmonella enterica subsp. enterica serovar Anatum]
LQKGLEQGLAQGREAEARAIARKMLANGLEPGLIASVTGITPPAIVPAPNEPDSTVAATSIDFKDFLDAASPVVFCLFFPASVP